MLPLKAKKRWMSLGIAAVVFVSGAIGMHCAEAEAMEREIPSVVSVLPLKNGSETVTPSPTGEPAAAPTANDPYTLTDEEAIEMGTYIYDNYVEKAEKVEGSSFNYYKGLKDGEFFKTEDMINYVCLFNQKYPTIYADRRSSLEYGDITYVNGLLEVFLAANSVDRVFTSPFPYSLFLKDGRPEKTLLEELESDFTYLSNNKVTNEEIYEYWGKVFKLAINADETFKDWHDFNFNLFYYTVKSQFYFMTECPQKYNNFEDTVPAKYVFGGNNNTQLDIDDAFGMRYGVRRSKYSGLNNQEFNAYAGCLEELCDKYAIINLDNNYVLQILNGSN